MIEKCPNPREDCPYYDQPPVSGLETDNGCWSNNHHQYWPKGEYSTAVERIFRQLPVNQEQTCAWEHDEIHAGEPPEKPSHEEMVTAISLSGIHLSSKLRKSMRRIETWRTDLS